ncbi:hypothetical protein NQZ68_038837 [Dissostichus eleginoides]|nr:hypothetical protein NQZ68_038837 [Dissostichus eleginoides]
MEITHIVWISVETSWLQSGVTEFLLLSSGDLQQSAEGLSITLGVEDETPERHYVPHAASNIQELVPIWSS